MKETKQNIRYLGFESTDDGRRFDFSITGTGKESTRVSMVIPALMFTGTNKITFQESAKICYEKLRVLLDGERIQEARGRYLGLDFQEGDAEQLSFSDSSFDAVVLNFGMLHLGRPEQALREAHRVLRQDGRIAFTVWDTPDKAIGFGIVIAAIQK